MKPHLQTNKKNMGLFLNRFWGSLVLDQANLDKKVSKTFRKTRILANISVIFNQLSINRMGYTGKFDHQMWVAKDIK